MSQFRFRLMARLVVIFISVTLAAQRITLSLTNPQISSTSANIFILTTPFLFVLSLIVLVEFLLYRKYGCSFFKYAIIFDILFSLAFTGEWVYGLRGSLLQTGSNLYTLSALPSFTAFAWRTLLQLLITQQWQFKIFPPTIAYVYYMWFAVSNQPEQALYILLRSIFQVIYIALIFYFDHKVNYMVLVGNVQQEQWLKLNEFILNNIPENIVILDLKGQCNFVSENFKRLMMRLCGPSCEIKQFFENIKDIQRQQQEDENELGDPDHIEILPFRTCASTKCNLNEEDIDPETKIIASLEDLIDSFSASILNNRIKERAFQVFDSKFKQEGNGKEERSFEIKISFINQQHDRYILLLLRDTTQRDLILTLEGNIKYKDHLLASISHELRTPLNSNINLLEAAIKSKGLCDEIKDSFLVPAVKSSKFLLHLINDILDMTQVKAQKLRLIFQQASLRDTLTNTIELLEPQAKTKGLHLETDISPELPSIFCTDHMRLSQIVLNLMNNSIKMTQKGYVKLSAWPQDVGCIEINIQDSGPGIPEGDVEKLFGDYIQVDAKSEDVTHPATSIGLGLKIANDLAKLLGPEGNQGIEVFSVVHKGSTFSFIIEDRETGLRSLDNLDPKDEHSPLPIVPTEFPIPTESSLEVKMTRNISTKSIIRLAREETRSMTTINSCSCAKVLVVDDDLFNMMAYEAILNSLGVKYECAYNGRSAIDKMLNRVRYPCSNDCSLYKVVFMDEEMPEMTGKETVAEIINLQRQNLLPYMNIVGCTAHHDGEEIEKFLKSGIVEYVPKPISIDVIKRILEKYYVKNG